MLTWIFASKHRDQRLKRKKKKEKTLSEFRKKAAFYETHFYQMILLFRLRWDEKVHVMSY